MAAKRPYTLICRRCQRVPELVGEEGHREVHCAQCGVRGEKEEILQVAYAHLVQCEIDRQGRDLMRNVAAGLKRVQHITNRIGQIGTDASSSTPDFIFRDG